MNLLKDVKITRVMSAVAAGTTDQDSDILDMQGYEGVMFIAMFGTLTATQVTAITAQQNTADSGTGMTDLEGTSVGPLDDADSDKCLVLDVYRPQERYVRCHVDRATANAVIDGIIAIQYNAHSKPVAQGSTISASEAHQSPDEGTA